MSTETLAGSRAIGSAEGQPGAPGAAPRDPALRRRNLFTALALVFLTIPLIPYVQEERVGWFMWRDAPVLALTFAGLGAIMILGWIRARRSRAAV